MYRGSQMASVALTLDVPEVITCHATPSVAQEVTYPLGASVVRVYFRSVAGKYYPTGTHDAAINSEAVTIPAGQWFEIQVPGTAVGSRARNLSAATRRGYFASATTVAVFEIMVLA